MVDMLIIQRRPTTHHIRIYATSDLGSRLALNIVKCSWVIESINESCIVRARRNSRSIAGHAFRQRNPQRPSSIILGEGHNLVLHSSVLRDNMHKRMLSKLGRNSSRHFCISPRELLFLTLSIQVQTVQQTKPIPTAILQKPVLLGLSYVPQSLAS